jgi:hypothetical protein
LRPESVDEHYATCAVRTQYLASELLGRRALSLVQPLIRRDFKAKTHVLEECLVANVEFSGNGKKCKGVCDRRSHAS